MYEKTPQLELTNGVKIYNDSFEYKKKRFFLPNIDRRNFIKETWVSLGSLFVLPSQMLFGKKEIKDVTGKVTQKPLTLPELPKEFEGFEIVSFY